jgi:hypothetical protein
MPSTQTRRKHLKSRDGCLQCKRRKVKCDENGVVPCRPCTKSRHACSFVAAKTTILNAPRNPLTTFSASTLLDFELLHNFSTKTAKTLADDQTFFSITLVQLSFGYDYLLHSILALSAFHIAHQHQNAPNPQESAEQTDKYRLTAYVHHDIALESYRHSLSDLNPQSCHSIFGCTCLLFMLALARPRETYSNSHSLDPPALNTSSPDLGTLLTEWIILVRGIPSILSDPELVSSLRQGPISALFNSPHTPSARKGIIDDHETMDAQASSFLTDLSSAFSLHSAPGISSICKSSIEKLHDALRGLRGSRDTVFAFTWPYTVDPEFLELLEQKTSEALLVLVCYCVLLNNMTERWWIKDWPREMIRDVKGLVEGRWIEWLRWPVETVFRGEGGL